MKLKKQRPIEEKPTFTTTEHYCTLFTSHLLNMQDVFFYFFQVSITELQSFNIKDDYLCDRWFCITHSCFS